ncbi:Calcium-independent phospholipase A2-gamma [Pseudocercospora fuligena]|uniref:Calcium-independent phospholipase A2-gamma n=1 Tax=Pseudocercospora fuligena TaxID=685502 RepID=A0A8H6VFM0_9PEZI|nr:Calcium-independent phospholipase A2-gamma [Pseudocercospora fuligena]
MALQTGMLLSGEQSALIGSADSGIVIPRTLPKCGRRYNSDSSAKSPWRRKIILSLDGGGIRGYASLKILERLMQKVERIEQSNESRHRAAYSQITSSAAYPWNNTPMNGNLPSFNPDVPYHSYDTGFRPHHYFDCFFGTSTGGLSSIMLGRLQMTVSTALKQYDIVGNSVFAHGRPYVTALGSIIVPKYRSRDMEQALSDVLKNGLAGRTLMRPVEELALQNENEGAARTVVVSHGPSALGGVSMRYLFRSYEHPKPSTRLTDGQEEDHLNPGPIPPTTIIEAARATSAAPTYFSEKEVGGLLYMDGAVNANSPVQLAYNEVTQMHHSQQPRLIISIGTGEAAEWQPHSAWRILKAVKRKADHISDFARNITDTEGPHKDLKKTIRHLPKAEQPHYFRFNVPSSSGICGIALDEWQPKRAGHGRSSGNDTKSRMEAAVKDYCDSKTVNDQLEECAKILVEVRRKRAETER